MPAMCSEGMVHTAWYPKIMQPASNTQQPTYCNTDITAPPAIDESGVINNELFDAHKPAQRAEDQAAAVAKSLLLARHSIDIVTLRSSSSAASSVSGGSGDEGDGSKDEENVYDVPPLSSSPVPVASVAAAHTQEDTGSPQLPPKMSRRSATRTEDKLTVALYNNVGVSKTKSKPRPAEPGTSSYDLKADSDNKVNECGFYYGSLSMEGADSKLKNCQEGTYLLRSSSHHAFAYSLSIRTCRGTTSVRIRHANGVYTLDNNCDKQDMAGFACVLDLVDYYAHLSADTDSHYVFVESSGRKDTPVHLKYPLMKDS